MWLGGLQPAFLSGIQASDQRILVKISPDQFNQEIGFLVTNRELLIKWQPIGYPTTYPGHPWRFSRDGLCPVCPAAPKNETQTYEGRISSGKVPNGSYPIIWDKKPYHLGNKKTNQPPSNVGTNSTLHAEPFSAEVQYRPGLNNPWRYPLVEIFLSNRTGQSIEWKRALLNGNELKALANGVWFQFYPSEKAVPGQTILLQICLADAPEKVQTIEIETQQGQRVTAKLEPFPPPPAETREKPKGMLAGAMLMWDFSHLPFEIPRSQITGMTFSGDFQRAFITFSRNPHVVKPDERVKPPAAAAQPAGGPPALPVHPLPSPTKRMLQPRELRLLWFAALAHAVKGITWYRHGREPGAPHVIGYDENPSLLAEIKKINADTKKLEPILGPSLFISKRTIGEPENGARQFTLWSGDEGVLVIVRNLDYTTSREDDDLGRNPRFKYTPKTNVPVVIRKPLWFKEAAAQGATKLTVTDPLTGQVFPHQEDAETIRVELPKAGFLPVEVLSWTGNRRVLNSP